MKTCVLILFSSLVLFSCTNTNENNSNGKLNDTSVIQQNETGNIKISISDPKEKNFVIGEEITIDIEIGNNVVADSLFLYINTKEKINLAGKKSFVWQSKTGKTGTNSFEVECFTPKGKIRASAKAVLYSDIKPKEFGFRVKNTYKHDVRAYTQGLFWHDGFLYEATGLEGESTVRKVKLETGDVVQSFAIPRDVFGEGITMNDNKIVQISWQNGKGFVYDLNTFQQTDEFSYGGEGWGITAGNGRLYMSDGTPKIKILDKDNYSVVEELEVYDNKGPVKYLNELEFIEGQIFANIYRYEKIARIDPATGKVIAYIDLSRILPMSDYDSHTDVLNGIAYDSAKKRIFVTGKFWPKLFEIDITQK